MDAKEFTMLLFEYEETQKKLKTIEQAISQYVLAARKTQAVGNVRATYRAPRKTYHYRQAWEKHGIENPEALSEFTTTRETVDYKAACEAYNITDVDWTEADPQVTIKVV
jgi:hypothetical protein